MQIATRQTAATDVQLARNSDRQQLQIGIEDVKLGVGYGKSDAHRPASGSTRPTADQMVVSVGPYIFQSSATAAEAVARPNHGQSFAAAPYPQIRFPCQPLSSSNRQVAGVACITVIPASLQSPAQARAIAHRLRASQLPTALL